MRSIVLILADMVDFVYLLLISIFFLEKMHKGV